MPSCPGYVDSGITVHRTLQALACLALKVLESFDVQKALTGCLLWPTMTS